MPQQPAVLWIERIGLSLAFGVTLVATRLLVLKSGFYDMPHAYRNTVADWFLDWMFFSVCCFVSLVAYTRLTNRQIDVSTSVYMLFLFLSLDALLGAAGAVAEGWRLGLNNFILGGVGLALSGAFIGCCIKAVVYAGTKLDRFLQHLRT